MKIAKEYPRQTKAVEQYIEKLHLCEEKRETNLDVAAGLTGELLAELFCWKEDEWQTDLRGLGFYLGKFIYIMDAYDDIEKDKGQGNYNALIPASEEEAFDDRCREMLNLVLAECASQFETLPCIEDIEILRNILYAGVWSGFDKKLKKQDNDKQE